jgi:hypothetical protein
MVRRTAAALAALTALVLVPGAAAQTPQLVARYHLDGAGTDSSGNGLDAVAMGSPETVVDGPFGGAFRFGDVTDGFAAAGNLLLEPPTITVAAWVRSPTAVGTVKTILSKGGNGNCSRSSYALYTGGSQDQPGVRFYIHNGGAGVVISPAAPQTIWNGVWHSVAGTYDGATVRLFVDRVEVGNGTPTSGAIVYGLLDNHFAIGNYAGKLFNGECAENTSWPRDIAEVLVFDRALSPLQVAALPVVPTPVPTPTPVATSTAVPTPTPAPTTSAPVVAADSDGDGIPDSEDTLPAGNLPPIAGKRVQSVAVSGELLVKLPDASGFVSLKGSASLPIGSIVDARQGELTIASATNAKGATASARLRAGIFKIRQAAAKGTKTVSTDLVLATPAGLSRACAPGRKRPPKGVVRTLSVTTTKGLFSTVAAKGAIKGANASWTVSDRCDGTLTRVTNGRVSVRSGKRTKTVRAGQRYLIKARLFAARRNGS